VLDALTSSGDVQRTNVSTSSGMRTEFDWKLDIRLGWKALSLNENDEAFRLDVHLGKSDVD
jgi:hypothetical protein